MAQEASPDDSPDIRRKAVTRLVIAGIVTAAALAALWWLDQSGKPAPGKATKAPAPIVSAPASAPAPVMPAPEPAAPEAAETDSAAPPPAAPGTVPAAPGTAGSPTDRPPPPVVRAPEPERTGIPETGRRSAPVPPAVLASSVRTGTPASAGDTGFVVQLGVFSDPVNARELVNRLQAAGVQARMETRVQVGPFRNRQEAERARGAIERLGVKGVVATK